MWELTCGCGDEVRGATAIDDTEMGRIWQARCSGCGASWTVEVAEPEAGPRCFLVPAPGRWLCVEHDVEIITDRAVVCPVWAAGVDGEARYARWRLEDLGG